MFGCIDKFKGKFFKERVKIAQTGGEFLSYNALEFV